MGWVLDLCPSETQLIQRRINGDLVAVRTEATDNSLGQVGEKGLASERFAGMWVG